MALPDGPAAREQRRTRRALLKGAHPDTGGSAEQFVRVLASTDPPRSVVQVHVHRRRAGPLGLLDDVRRARTRRSRPARVG
jgi:hypothetical protein